MTVPLATIVIPIGVSHIGLAERAIRSAGAQTVACFILPIVDSESRGAGWARNQGLAQAETDFVVFLDADDELLPTFVERTWQLQQQIGRYVYTDFYDGDILRTAPDCAWINDDWHAVTTLLPTDWARAVGGFDETLPGGEDSEFYFRLVTENYCGTRLPEALMRYHNLPDSRSKRWRNSPAFGEFRTLIEEKYLRKGKVMGCCTDPATPLVSPDSAAPGRVLARPRWGGNRRERGQVTGILYPNADNGVVIEVDPRDAQARPDHWEVLATVAQPPPLPVIAPVAVPVTPQPELDALARFALQIKPPPPPPVQPPPPAQVMPTSPNIERVVRLAQQRQYPPIKSNDGGWHLDGTGSVEIYEPPMNIAEKLQQPGLLPPLRTPIPPRMGDPLFVFPNKDYPSYTDVKRLVELSGFVSIHQGEESIIEQGQAVIWLSPEQPPEDIAGDMRHIWWSLEYGGEYEPDLSNWRGEIWASDPAWAQVHNAKMVVMGSHPGLKDDGQAFMATAQNQRYDVVMLAYMTQRREVIRQQLSDLRFPAEVYPGHDTLARVHQLVSSSLMLHVHQRDDTHAIAPQRIALVAAYKLPLICESVPDAGEYGHYLPFVNYENLNAEVRSQLSMMDTGMPQARADMLYHWLCEEHTFRKSVEEALK